ncbi:MAG: hypothetical protein EBE86_023140 [Hormoscilla sp. GUM202]|nr:hypothetical protein [Hormoscilla sp. GUM202]
MTRTYYPVASCDESRKSGFEREDWEATPSSTPAPRRAMRLIENGARCQLEELDIDFWPLGSTTFKNKLMQQGIEPDNCFYIENEAAMSSG